MQPCGPLPVVFIRYPGLTQPGRPAPAFAARQRQAKTHSNLRFENPLSIARRAILHVLLLFTLRSGRLAVLRGAVGRQRAKRLRIRPIGRDRYYAEGACQDCGVETCHVLIRPYRKGMNGGGLHKGPSLSSVQRTVRAVSPCAAAWKRRRSEICR